MLAFQVTEIGKPLSPSTCQKPQPHGRELLVRTLVTGVCHTDLHVIKGELGPLELPRTPGHEGVGIVETVGPDVRLVKAGDRVGCAWLGLSCLECELCKSGRENLCTRQTQTGFKRDGSFAEYFIVDERFAARIPDALSDAEAAPLLCAGLTAYRGVRIGEFQKGARIVIAGASGGLGHMAVQYAKALGLEVVALDHFTEEKQKLVQSCGADFVVEVHTDRERLASVIQNLKPLKPVGGAVVFAPRPEAIADAVAYCSPGATIVTIALPPGDLSINAVDFVLKELRLQGSIVGTPTDLREALNYAAVGKVRARIKEDKLEAVNEALAALSSGSVTGRLVLRVAK